jgi:hypothetical protein
MTTNSRPLAVATAALALLLLGGGGGVASAQQAAPGTNQQVSPAATAPLPTEGPGQAPMGAAVGGSAPNPASLPTTTDNSQAQQGVLLKPGQGANDMGAAAGAKPQQ